MIAPQKLIVTRVKKSDEEILKTKDALTEKHKRDKNVCNRNLPTRPNKTQYTAANMVKGIDANKAPNFPARIVKSIPQIRNTW